MASGHQGVQELMAAETRASQIVSCARAERGERMKQAKAEADVEIEAYRAQMEAQFSASAGSQAADYDAEALLKETEQEIANMNSAFDTNKMDVIQMMVAQTTKVQIEVPEARVRLG